MKITILNGEPDSGSGFDAYVHEVAAQMAIFGHDVETIELRDLDIKGCSGCWGCWAKTPGECVKRDDTEQTCRAIVHSDLVVLASPMAMGFTSALLKRMADQLIPLVHPYGLIEGGEMHHLRRYEHYSVMGLLLGAGPDTDAEDIEITQTMWSRTARNLKTHLAFTSVADRPAKEVAREFATVA